MATQTGELQIESIEGRTLRGWFRSVYDGNVYTAHPSFAVAFLQDAWASNGSPKGALAEIVRDEAALLRVVTRVAFDTPGGTSTYFDLEVSDAALFEGLESIYWESYLIG